MPLSVPMADALEGGMIVSIEALRLAARRILPRWLFDYVDGGAYSETTMRRNLGALAERYFVPRVLRGVSRPNARTTLFGHQQDVPVMLAPVGMAGMLSPQGEIKAARAAARQGVTACLSHFSIVSVEDVARVVDPVSLAFQLYIFRDRDLTRDMVSRAWARGIRTLVVTVDTPVTPMRARDARNGFRNLSRLSARHVGHMALRPAWSWAAARRGGRTMGNLDRYKMGTNLFAQAATIARELDPDIGWHDLAWLRDVWKGKLVVKGVMLPEDTVECVRIGAEGIVISNHGGRQLDGAVAGFDVLEENVRAAGGRAQVVVDGGFRYGSDVVKALALGASGVMLGRPYAYGLAADGEQGVVDVLEYFRQGIHSTMTLLGVGDLSVVKDIRMTSFDK
ncbi:alpha-hydroxy acid oxidase [Nguyenibacter vanlangensis]|nr:alpha-hydroxy acid oxidase [Nguyenibacter vanlangensis]